MMLAWWAACAGASVRGRALGAPQRKLSHRGSVWPWGWLTGARVSQEGIEEGREGDIGMVGGSCWCKREREGIGCTPAQTEPPWLSLALGVANGGSCEPGGY